MLIDVLIPNVKRLFVTDKLLGGPNPKDESLAVISLNVLPPWQISDQVVMGPVRLSLREPSQEIRENF